MIGTAVDRLTTGIGDAPVVVFCGAGVIAGSKVPTWHTLLSRLLRKAVEQKMPASCSPETIDQIESSISGSKLSIYQRADLVRALLGKQYLHALRSELYAECEAALLEPEISRAQMADCPFVWSVVDLCQCEQVSAVVTYNYDDILLRALKGAGERPAYHVCGERRSMPEYPGLPVYYIHGYLPHLYRPPSEAESQVVLSQDSYFHNMMEAFSWQTTTQLHFLLNAACIFLGTSLDDVNMMRILSYAQHYSQRRCTYAIMSRKGILLDMHGTGEFGEPVKEFLLATKAALLRDVGVELITVEDYGDLPRLISELAQHMRAKLRPNAGNTTGRRSDCYELSE